MRVYTKEQMEEVTEDSGGIAKKFEALISVPQIRFFC